MSVPRKIHYVLHPVAYPEGSETFDVDPVHEFDMIKHEAQRLADLYHCNILIAKVDATFCVDTGGFVH